MAQFPEHQGVHEIRDRFGEVVDSCNRHGDGWIVHARHLDRQCVARLQHNQIAVDGLGIFDSATRC